MKATNVKYVSGSDNTKVIFSWNFFTQVTWRCSLLLLNLRCCCFSLTILSSAASSRLLVQTAIIFSNLFNSSFFTFSVSCFSHSPFSLDKWYMDVISFLSSNNMSNLNEQLCKFFIIFCILVVLYTHQRKEKLILSTELWCDSLLFRLLLNFKWLWKYVGVIFKIL